MFGNLSNYKFGFERPDLIIFLSASPEDISYVLHEINVFNIPLINLSKKNTDLDFFRISGADNFVLRKFVMQLLYYHITILYPKTIDMDLNNQIRLNRNEILGEDNRIKLQPYIQYLTEDYIEHKRVNRDAVYLVKKINKKLVKSKRRQKRFRRYLINRLFLKLNGKKTKLSK